jgi:nuclear pore complex protein Nup98-Nup96
LIPERCAFTFSVLLPAINSFQRTSFGHDIEPPLYRPSRKYARVQGSESTFVDNENAVFDAGLAFGRSFRVGWGPGGTLVHLGALCGPSSAS